MRTEYISLSVAGAWALALAGLFLGRMISGQGDLGQAAVLIMLVVCVRADMRESISAGTYNRGWLVWRRTGPVADPESRT